MNVFILNLPSDVPIVRRYMCSSFAEQYLFPPHDLVALAGIARNKGYGCLFLDAVAEKYSIEAVLAEIKNYKPDIIISIISFELYDKDVDFVKQIKTTFPNISYGLFGHYPTHFPLETLQHSLGDFIMLGEPDHVFENILENCKNGQISTSILGTVVKSGVTTVKVNEGDRRVPNPNLLPMPAYDLIKQLNYREPLMPYPTGLVQSARGCPYKCNYCVHSFGTKLTVLTPENVIEHILFQKRVHNIKALRFIDDTFTAIPSRVIKICKLMIDNNINLPWTCLSRADTLDEEMLIWMKKSGCVRLNIGMESGSQAIVDFLDKGVNVEQCGKMLERAHQLGFELMGFFLVGIPGETRQDIEQSIRFAKRHFDFIVVDCLKVYPGTSIFHKLKEEVDFALYPYINDFKSKSFNRHSRKMKSLFYLKYYFSWHFMVNVKWQNLFNFSELKVLSLYVFRNILQR